MVQCLFAYELPCVSTQLLAPWQRMKNHLKTRDFLNPQWWRRCLARVPSLSLGPAYVKHIGFYLAYVRGHGDRAWESELGWQTGQTRSVDKGWIHKDHRAAQ
ncbi:hypothetical protein GCM10009554_04990 [Kribbella koreensis]|uniref:Uncharacterized protein n=1 Tax=Kribbella koreensis TaxID=57909 RepID=A0ABN1PCE1_9ACTN